MLSPSFLSSSKLSFQKLHQITDQAAQWLARLGGVVLLCLAVMTVLSVIGRGINAYGFGPIQGDFELMEHGVAFFVFCALPYCQMRLGHVSVDVLARYFPKILSTMIAVISQAGMALMAIIVTRQLYLGLIDKYLWQETTFILQFPVWWGYAISLPASGLWAITSVIMTLQIIAQPDYARDAS